MAKPLSILYVTSELAPFAKVGGIADVSYSFPLAVRDIGHDIRVMMPKYGTISERKNRIHEINRLKDIPIPVGKSEEPATVKSSSINNPRTKVQAYITTNYKYFDAKKGIYGNVKTGEEYADNDERFIFFNRSVIETCLLLGWFPDIIHCNDWQSALIPAYARVMFPNKFKKTKIVLTIHNFSEQGVYPFKSFEKTGLPKKAENDFKHKNKFNFLKGGIIHADYVTTVSPQYADEILKDSKYSDGLNKTLAQKKKYFKGIMNGIDTWGWDPKTDILIKKKLSSDFDEYKEDNKTELLKQFGLDYNPDTPVIGMIARMGAQKGFPMLIDAADDLLKEDFKLVILTYGDSEQKKNLKKITKKYSDKISVVYGFDENLAHLIEAGSDMFLIPSLYEPCGLNSMYSLTYGTVPVVRSTGGLKGIVSEFSAKSGKGNGFSFSEYKPESMVKAVKKALKLFGDKDNWKKIIENGMNGDYSWDESVQEYDEIYSSLKE